MAGYESVKRIDMEAQKEPTQVCVSQNAPEKQAEKQTGETIWSAGVFAGTSYVVCSMTMVLGNKAIAYLADISGMQVGAVFFQNAVAVALMAPSGGKALSMESMLSVLKETSILAFLFVMMLVSSLAAFQHVGIATVVLMKNFSTMGTIVGERILFGRKIANTTIVAFVLMFVANMLYAKFDLHYSAIGYAWCVSNAFSTSAYALFMQRVTTSSPVSKQGLVIYTNLFSLPILAAAIVFRGEMAVIAAKMPSFTPTFIGVNIMVALTGGVLGYCSMWTVQTLGAGTLSMLGTLNKVPLVILGTVLFGDNLSVESALFCGLGVFAGCIFTVGKAMDPGRDLAPGPKHMGLLIGGGLLSFAVLVLMVTFQVGTIPGSAAASMQAGPVRPPAVVSA